MTVKSTIFGSFLSASFVACFFVAYESGSLQRLLHRQLPSLAPMVASEAAVAPKRNIMMSDHSKSGGETDEVPQKGGITGSVAYMSAPTPTSPVAAESEVTALETEAGFAEVSSQPDIQPAALTLPEGIPAMLRRGPRGPEIGHFRSATIAGDAEDCLSTAYSMMASVQIPDQALTVMVATKPITIAKLCANNGVVIFTCRNNTITVSPRQSRPDNNCPSST